jgi:lysine decarboxylase/arginine decarboxylase
MFKPEAIKQSIRQNPLIPREKKRIKPMHTVVTNSTYDGLCYNVTDVIGLLDKSVDRIHFDEAWYGYARFNPIYKERFAMHGNPDKYRGPTLFATQSTHKLLAALSQASFIHVRDGRDPIEFSRFNEAFMMHGSTSPQYSIIASNDIAAGMMDGPGGQALTADSIKEAVAFRKTMARLYKEFQAKGDWFFNVWQPEKVYIGKGKTVSFEDAPDRKLHNDPSCWVLRPGAKWHGFGNLKDNYCMLDPIKVSVITPGVADDGSLENSGIPAMLVTAYLDAQGIVVEKTGDFTMLFLFSMGVTRGKWGTLVTALLDFKQCYDANMSLSEVLPSLVKSYPKRYKNIGLRDLSTEMFKQVRKGNNLKLLDSAFSLLPQASMTPAEAYGLLVKNKVVQLPIDDMANRTVATGVVPYPPGIPLLMPGENAGKYKDAILAYLRALQAFDRLFPGFEHDIHGVENKDGTYNIYCIKEK